MSDEQTRGVFGTATVWHPRGVSVQMPVPFGPTGLDHAGALRAVAAALDAGWLAAAPGLEAGEEKEEIGWVVRRSKTNDDGSVTPVVDLYVANDHLKHPILSVYLNKPEDVAAFEYASGMRLAAIEEYIGDNKIERGKKPALDKLVTRAPKPFGVIFGPNPRYDEREAAAVAARGKGEVYGVAKRKIVRWADQRPAQTGDAPPANGTRQAGSPQTSPQQAGAPSESEFMELLERKGKTLTEALVAIDAKKGTRYAADRAPFAAVNPEHLAGYARWLEKQEDVVRF